MLPDAASVAKHPALAEFALREQQAEIARLLALLTPRSAPLAPEALRAALATQPQALEFSADAI
ncbi:hypothetical protein [Delftia acidovorans]|uniref:Uncharacterized protein n=1 Tax=Delftia acidovorans TaxID=80866 RepID=A0AAJ2R7L3_DELAC|nr:hypothetical protein [Delftia acidovorans]MDX4957266.1 hypothetical protein [Delftia acidovorans]